MGFQRGQRSFSALFCMVGLFALAQTACSDNKNSTLAANLGGAGAGNEVFPQITDTTQAEDESLVVAFTPPFKSRPLACDGGNFSYTSSNVDVIPASDGVVFGGTWPDCTASLTPVANASGTSTIVFSFANGQNSFSTQFTATVTAVNDAPTLAAISAQTTAEDTPLQVSFTAADVDGPLACDSTHLSYGSDNSALVANTGAVAWSGTWPNCVGTIALVQDAYGTGNITFTVSDGSATAARTFALSVSDVIDTPNTAPTLNVITAGSIAEVDQDETITTSGLTGTLVGVDSENNTLSYRIQGGALANDGNWYKPGTKGTLIVNNSTGAYQYVLFPGQWAAAFTSPIESLTAGQTVTETFALEAFDGNLASVSKDFVVTLTGANERTKVCANTTAGAADVALSVTATNGSEVDSTPAVFTITRCTADQANARDFYYTLNFGGTGASFGYTSPAGCLGDICKGTFAAGSATATVSVPISSNGVYGSSTQYLRLELVLTPYYGLRTTPAYADSTIAEATAAPAAPTGTPDVSLSVANIYTYRRSASTSLTSLLGVTKSLAVANTYSTTVSGDAILSTDYTYALKNNTSWAASSLSANQIVSVLANTNASASEVYFDINFTSANSTFLTSSVRYWLKPYSATGVSFIGSSETQPYSFSGTDGNDTVTGGNNAVVLYGQGGNDVLVAGALTKTLSGSTGSDTFVFPAATTSNTTKMVDVTNWTIATGGDYDKVALWSTPTEVWRLFPLCKATFAEAMQSVFTDKNPLVSGNQPLLAGEAVLFKWGPNTANCYASLSEYLVVANSTAGYDANDFVVKVSASTGLTDVSLPSSAMPLSTYFTSMP